MCIKPPVLTGTTASPRPCWVPKKQLDAVTNHSRGLLNSPILSAPSISSGRGMSQRDPPDPQQPLQGGFCSSPIFQHVKFPDFCGRKLNPPATLTTPLPFSDPEIKLSSVFEGPICTTSSIFRRGAAIWAGR